MRRSLDDCLAQIDRCVAFRQECTGNGPQIGTPFARLLLDAVALFSELEIGYALVGGTAAMCYGRARFTEDVDFVTESGLMAAVDANHNAIVRHHFDPNRSGKLYHASGIEIDIWKDEFSDDIVRRATTVTLAGKVIRIADHHDLVAMKLRANRLQDDYDISEIIKAGGLDETVLAKLVTPSEFAHFQTIRSRT